MTSIPSDDKNCKQLDQTLLSYGFLNTGQSVVIQKPGHIVDNFRGKLSNENNSGFRLTIEEPDGQYHLNKIKEVKLLTSNYLLHVNKLLITSISREESKIEIFQFNTEGFSTNEIGYYRLIVPLKKEISFDNQLTPFRYSTEKLDSPRCLRISYNKSTLDLFIHQGQGKKWFLIIDSTSYFKFADFQNYSYSAMLALGYLSGTFSRDEAYFFMYKNSDLETPDHIYYCQFGRSMSTHYTPILTNGHRMITDQKEAEKFSELLQPLSPEQFSKLCQWLYDSREFTGVVLLIIESMASSLIMMPAGLAIALESLTEILVENHTDKLNPVKDKQQAKKIRSELLAVLDFNKTGIDEEGFNIIKSRIMDYNKPTNTAKLTKPFQMLNIKLSSEDKKAIGHRNDFLHGNIPFLNDNDQNIPVGGTYYIIIRLYTLLAALILKKIGFDGLIVNYPKLLEYAFDKSLDEEIFRKI
ncbi:MAG: hypothetical protein QM764_20680 [Chitinophagaceae bacterium]